MSITRFFYVFSWPIYSEVNRLSCDASLGFGCFASITGYSAGLPLICFSGVLLLAAVFFPSLVCRTYVTRQFALDQVSPFEGVDLNLACSLSSAGNQLYYHHDL